MDYRWCVWTLLTCIVYAQCQPYRPTTEKQACGDKLADIMSLVCSERGYNVAFRPQEGLHRARRGIVEECCRNSCTQDILELYCRPEIPDNPTNAQIRKRSDNEKSWSAEDNTNTILPTLNDPSDTTPRPTQPTTLFHVLTSMNTEMPNTITNADLYSREATQRTIQERINSLFQHHDRESSGEVQSDKDSAVETNSLGYILNTLIKNDANIVHQLGTKRPAQLTDTIRHRHSKKTLHRYQTNKLPSRKSSEEDNTAFRIGIKMPYYSGRKQSRPRGHH